MASSGKSSVSGDLMRALEKFQVGLDCAIFALRSPLRTYYAHKSAFAMTSSSCDKDFLNAMHIASPQTRSEFVLSREGEMIEWPSSIGEDATKRSYVVQTEDISFIPLELGCQIFGNVPHIKSKFYEVEGGRREEVE
jgi:hypothetical protein